MKSAAKQSVAAGPAPEARALPAAQQVKVARSGGRHPPVTGRREPPKPAEAKPKRSDFETEMLAAWDS